MSRVLIPILLATLSACTVPHRQSSPASPHPATLYDYRLLDAESRRPINLDQLAARLQRADVVFVGEFHGHQASHLLQMELLEALHRHKSRLVLAMEQFSRDKQSVVDNYLAGEYGEETFIEAGDAWDNYKGSYRPLLEFARGAGIPVLAANAPVSHVRCVARHGPEILDKLPAAQKRWSADQLNADTPEYRAKFDAFMDRAGDSHGVEEGDRTQRLENRFAAQMLRDATMAQSLAMAMDKHPEATIVHLTGAFHSDFHLGTVEALQASRPKSRLVVLSPVMTERGLPPGPDDDVYDRGDYLYFLEPLPPAYIDEEKRARHFDKLKARADAWTCPLAN